MSAATRSIDRIARRSVRSALATAMHQLLQEAAERHPRAKWALASTPTCAPCARLEHQEGGRCPIGHQKRLALPKRLMRGRKINP